MIRLMTPYFWANITEQLLGGDPKAIRVPIGNRPPETSKEFVAAAYQASVGSEVSGALGSDDADVQLAALWDIHERFQR
jgi:hypothetical protein